MNSNIAMSTTASKKKVVEIDQTPATQAEINQAVERLILSRVYLLLNRPFFGNVITRFGLVEASSWVGTAATCGRNIYFNPKFINMLKDKEVIFLLAHEVFHAVFDHLDRFKEHQAQPQLANIAADYVVNDFCVEEKLGDLITTVPVLYDKKYHGWTFEEVYDDLYEKAEKIDLSALSGDVLDNHLDGSGNGSGEDGKDGNGPPKMSASERQAMKDDLREALLNAAQAVGAGNVPSGIRRMLTELTEPKMNWREILRQQIESQVKTDQTYMRPSRRSWGIDAILPAMQKEPAVECTIAIDASGSMGEDMLRDILSEVVGITQQHSAFKINVFSFDTKAYDYQTFTEENVDDLYTYPIKGGGGTQFSCIFDELEDKEVKQLVVITDGYPCDSDWGCSTGEWDGVTTFMIHGDDQQRLKSPWGETVHYSK